MADLNDNTSIYSKRVVNKLKVYEADNQHNKSYDTLNLQATRLNSEIINYSNKSDAPIGLFDSGVGGLSVYKHLAQQLPSERYIYYADTKHVPYGNRESRDIENLTLNAIDWLYHQGCKLIVIACNSASAYALEIARYRYPQLPIVGLVPALKPAVLNSKSGKIAVLATKATLQGDLLNQVITEVAAPRGYTVTKYFDPCLVPWVEAGMPEHSETAERLKQMLKDFCAEGIDYLVLGCTHYPFFREFLLKQIADSCFDMQVVDSGQAIAARVQHLLVINKILALDRKDDFVPPLTFYASKYDSQLIDMLPRLLGAETTIHYEL